MSHYIVKYVSFNNKEKKITETVACNNCRPLRFVKSECQKESMTYEQNIEYYFVDMLNGNRQGGQAKIKEILEMLRKYKKIHCPDISFDMDLKMHTEFDNGLNHLISKMIAVPIILKRDYDETHVSQALHIYNRTAKEKYENLEKEYADKGWIMTGSCARSDVFEDCDVWSVRDKNQIIVGERSCYETAPRGFCNTKAGKYVIIEEGNIRGLWHLFSYGTQRSMADLAIEYGGEDAISRLPWDKLACFALKKPPIKDFPYEMYGFKMA